MLTRWNPFYDFSMLLEPYYRFGEPPRISHSENAATISLDLPGADIRLETDNDILKLYAKKTEGEKTVTSREWSWSLGNSYDADRISAVYQKGVLLITLPKMRNSPKEIKIQTKIE